GVTVSSRRWPAHRARNGHALATGTSVDTRIGVRARSCQSAAPDASLSAVQVSPDSLEVVCPSGSRRGSQGGHVDRLRRPPLPYVEPWLLRVLSHEAERAEDGSGQ